MTDAVPGRYHFFLARMYGLIEADKINLFSCDLLKFMHLHLQSASNEKLYWTEALDHFNKTGILDIMAKTLNISTSLYGHLGYALAYSLSVHLTSLRKQYNPLDVNLGLLTYSDWDQVQRVLMTYQYGLYDKWMADVQMTRNMGMFFLHFERKIACLD